MSDDTIPTAGINDLRARIYRGDTYSRDEIREQLAALRQKRQELGDSSQEKKSSGRGKKPTTDLSDLAGGQKD